jgi:hypothetical protein
MRVLKRTGDHYASTRGFTVTLPIELFRRLQQLQDRARTARLDMGGILAAAIEDAANAIENLLTSEVGSDGGAASELRDRRFTRTPILAPEVPIRAVIFPPAGAAGGRRGRKQWLRFARS